MLTQFFVQMDMRVVLFYKESTELKGSFFSDIKHRKEENINELKFKATVLY